MFCVSADGDTAQLRILLVDPVARGHGLGARLTRCCVDFARDAGYRRMRLWTNHPLTAARRIYLAAGFGLVDTDSHHSFGVDWSASVRARLPLAIGQPAKAVEAFSSSSPSAGPACAPLDLLLDRACAPSGVIGRCRPGRRCSATSRARRPAPGPRHDPVVHVALGHPEVREQGAGLLGHADPLPTRGTRPLERPMSPCGSMSTMNGRPSGTGGQQ